MARKGAPSLERRRSRQQRVDSDKWREFDRTIEEVRRGFADMQPDELEELIREAVKSVREERRLSGGK